MADILLTHANHLYSDRKQVRKMQPYPPLQTLIAAACLRRHGYEVALFDATLNSPMEGFQAAVERHRPRLVAVCEDNFNFLTKMCLSQNRELTFSMFQAARQAEVPAVVNSSDASDNIADYLEAGAKFVMIGELEKTILDVADLMLRPNGRDAGQIDGLAFRDQASAKVSYTVRRRVMDDPGLAAGTGLGFSRLGAVSRCLENEGPPFFTQHGFQPWLPVSMQLVRETDLRGRLPLSLRRERGVGNGSPQIRARRRALLVRRRHLRPFGKVDPGLSPTRWNGSMPGSPSRCKLVAT